MKRVVRATMLTLAGIIMAAGSLTTQAYGAKYGAGAINDSNGAFGFAYDYDNQTDADKRASNECGQGCSVVIRFGPGQCGAFARGSGTSYGWGIASTLGAAKHLALEECNKRGSACEARVWGCNSR